MEHYKVSKLLNDSPISKFFTRKCIKVNDLSSGQYSLNKNIIQLLHYIQIFLIIAIHVLYTPFRSCISQINNTSMNEEDLNE